MRGIRGFSLVEAIVAFVLTFFLIIFLFSVFPVTRQALQLAENHANAAVIGRSLLSDARRVGFDNVVASSGTRTIAGTNNGAPFSQTFNYAMNVQTITATRKQVWATVTWRERTGNKQVILETIMVKP